MSRLPEALQIFKAVFLLLRVATLGISKLFKDLNVFTRVLGNHTLLDLTHTLPKSIEFKSLGSVEIIHFWLHRVSFLKISNEVCH